MPHSVILDVKLTMKKLTMNSNLFLVLMNTCMWDTL